MKQNMLVSFIVTTYNLPVEYLKTCLESILRLSLGAHEREIILVDDGSDLSPLNDLLDIIDQITYVRQPNGGPSAARNTGLQMAHGKYVQFVDGDDWLLQAPYEHCLDLARYHNPDIVHFSFTDKETDEVQVPFSYTEPVNGSSYLHNNNLQASVWCYLFRLDILQNLRFTPGLLPEDEEFTPLLFLRAERIITTDAKAYFYRQREGSITHTSQNKRTTLQRLDDTERIIYHLNDVACHLSKAERVALGRRVAQLSMDYLYQTIILTRSSRQLNERISRLHDHGLFPLPDKHYTRKYTLFRRAINNPVLREMMVIAMPKIK